MNVIVSEDYSSVQSLSHVRLFATPWIAACQASLSITNSRSSLRLMSIESVMPSSHLILCHPLFLLPPIPLSIRVFSNESTLCMRWPKHWSFSFSIIPSNVAQLVKNLPAMWDTWVQSLCWEDPLEKGKTAHSSILAWRILWMSMESQSVGHDSNFQSLSLVQFFVTPWTAAHQASLSIIDSQSLLKLISIELVMPSNHLILCRPLRLPSIFPRIRVFSKESVLHSRWPKYWSFSTSPLSMNIEDWFLLGWTGWISLKSKGLSRVFSNTTVQKHQFFTTQLSLWSKSHIHIWPLEKP